MNKWTIRHSTFLAVMSGVVIACALTVVWQVKNDADGPGLDDFRRSSAINEVKHFSTLSDLTEASDLIVNGKVKEVRDGRLFGREGLDQVAYLVAVVQVEEVIAGKWEGRTVLVEFFVGPAGQGNQLKEALLEVSGTWFLTDKQTEAVRLGLTGDLVSREAGLHMLVNSQGLVVNDHGTSRTPLSEDFDSELYHATNAQAFRVVADNVRAAAN